MAAPGADALAIFEAGLRAVDSATLVRDNLRVDGHTLWVADRAVDLGTVRHIAVVGAGKAGAGMVAGVEEALGAAILGAHGVHGWVNVPADCGRETRSVHLHPARPAGVNEPTPEAESGARRILEIVAALGPDDLCLCLISGGGSALLPVPAPGLSVDHELVVTRLLGSTGADIAELNTVRKHLSAIKGGGLARACRAGGLATLVISDVLGDPLDLIASGPTVDDPSTSADALAVLERFAGTDAGVPRHVLDHLRAQPASNAPLPATTTNHVIGNLATAARAAAQRARDLGYAVEVEVADAPEGPVEDVARRLVRRTRELREAGGRRCLISGGEPTVTLPPAAERGHGGRNQQLALLALSELDHWDGVALLSAGTDGEDGPTDAAGARVDAAVAAAAGRAGLDAADHLRRCDAHTFFRDIGGLVVTGPTHTNVCDLRIVLTHS